MEYNSYLSSSAVKETCRDYITYLTNEIDAYKNLKKRLDIVKDTNYLEGDIKTALKDKIFKFEEYIDLLIRTDESDKTDTNALMSLVGDETYDGSVILTQKSIYYKQWSDNCRSASDCEGKSRNAADQDSKEYWSGQASYYRGLASSAWDTYDFYYQKEKRYDEINADSSKLFKARENWEPNEYDKYKGDYPSGTFDAPKIKSFKLGKNELDAETIEQLTKYSNMSMEDILELIALQHAPAGSLPPAGQARLEELQAQLLESNPAAWSLYVNSVGEMNSLIRSFMSDLSGTGYIPDFKYDVGNPLFSEEYIVGTEGETRIVIRADKIKEILEKDIEDITDEEWNYLIEAANVLEDGEVDLFVSQFVSVKYNDFNGIQVGIDIEKYNKFLELLKDSYNDNYQYGFTLDSIGKNVQMEDYQRYILYSSIPVDQIQNNYFDLYEKDRDKFADDEEYLNYVRSIIQEKGEYIPKIEVIELEKGVYSIVYYESSEGYSVANIKNVNVSCYSEDEKGKRIGLEPKFVKVYDPDTNSYYYGGDQGWFTGDEAYINKSGCGAIAAVNTYLYMIGVESITKDEFMELVREFDEMATLDSWEENATILYPDISKIIEELGDSTTHSNLGEILKDIPMAGIKPLSGASPWEIGEYIEKKLAQDGVTINTSWTSYEEDQWDSMQSMLEKGQPVVWGLFDLSDDEIDLKVYNSKKDTYETVSSTNSHYVTVTGLIEHDNGDGTVSRLVEISTWSDKMYIDYDEYLDNIIAADNPIEYFTDKIGSGTLTIVQ